MVLKGKEIRYFTYCSHDNKTWESFHLTLSIKVIAGILFPPFLATLEYKSKKELKFMPQTAEEHLEGTVEDEDSDENEENDSYDPNDDSIQQV